MTDWAILAELTGGIVETGQLVTGDTSKIDKNGKTVKLGDSIKCFGIVQMKIKC